MEQNQFAQHRFVRRADLQMQGRPHARGEIRQRNGPFALRAGDGQQQRSAAFLGTVPPVEQTGFIQPVGIIDGFAQVIFGKPARDQGLARTRRAKQDGGAEWPAFHCAERVDSGAVGITNHDPAGRAGAGVQR